MGELLTTTSSLLALEDACMDNNPDNNQTLRKKLSLLWDPDPWSILNFQHLCFSDVATGKLPKRLGP